MAVKGILFDKDGTLIDFFEVWGAAVEPVLTQLLQIYGLEKNANIKEAIKIKLGINGTTIDSEGAFAWKPYSMIAEDLAEILQEPDSALLTLHLINLFQKEITEKRTNYSVFTNIPLFTKQLREAGILVGIATTDEYYSTKTCMKKIGFDTAVSFYGTAGQQMPMKPCGKLIDLAAAAWHIKNEEIAIVGDAPNDMSFAKNGGATAIAVLSGTGNKKNLEPLADYLIPSINELIPLLNGIRQKENENGKN